MKYSIITAALLFKVDTEDFCGFTLYDAINKVVINRLKKGKL